LLIWGVWGFEGRKKNFLNNVGFFYMVDGLWLFFLLFPNMAMDSFFLFKFSLLLILNANLALI